VGKRKGPLSEGVILSGTSRKMVRKINWGNRGRQKAMPAIAKKKQKKKNKPKGYSEGRSKVRGDRGGGGISKKFKRL